MPKAFQGERERDPPSLKGGRYTVKGSFLAKNSWIGFLQLYSVQKQIVGNNLGLPATQTHKRMRGSIPWIHTIKWSQQLCSYSVRKVQRKTNEQVPCVVFLYFINGCPYYVPGALSAPEIDVCSSIQCSYRYRVTEAVELSLTNQFANIIVSLKIKFVKFLFG